MQWLEKVGSKELLVEKEKKLLIIAGPCVIENPEMAFDTAKELQNICEELQLPFIFKASYDKANRTSIDSFRGVGMKEGLAILNNIKEELGIPVTSDVHEVIEVEQAAKVLDVIQIPAFLCRQTDLIYNAAKTGKTINVKKGQFMSPWEVEFIVDKIRSTGNHKLLITERGTTFGYNNLINDFRGIKIMQKFSPVVFDLTHSVQLPGGGKGQSSGQREFIPLLGRAAVASGVYGVFLEVHPEPEKALSDKDTQFPLKHVKRLLTELEQIFNLVKNLKSWDNWDNIE